MKIPMSLKVGAQRIRVIKKDCLSFGYLGRTLPASNMIEIAMKDSEGKVITESCIVDTFLHEVIHTISCNYGVGLTERQVSGLSGGLLSVIRDNKLDFSK